MIGNIEPLVLAVIMFASRVFDIPGPLIAAVIMTESSFNLHAVGGHDKEGVPQAYGPLQLSVTGAGAGWPVDTLINWQFNIMLGSDYLKQCLDAFPRNKKLGIAAFLQGIPGTALHGYAPVERYVDEVLDNERMYQASWGVQGETTMGE